MAEFETITLTLVGFPPASGKPAQQMSIIAQTQKGSGLAYHLVADEPGEAPGNESDMSAGTYQENEEDVYIITQVCSGKRLGKGGVATPRQAKLWIGLLCKLYDWNKDLEAILATVKGNNRRDKISFLARQVEQARQEAIEQTFFVISG